MKVSDFDFELDESLIAQSPLDKRDQSRLMVLNRSEESIHHHLFSDLPFFLKKGDVLVRNNTRVIPARLFGVKAGTNAHVEVLLLHQEGDVWECLVGNARVVKLGTVLNFGDGLLKATCQEVKEEGIRIFLFEYEGIFYEVLDQIGKVPLPPYIKQELLDRERYQTVYAKIKGSAAAPTAGLHFTPAIFTALSKLGVEMVDITLHVGLGTFRPVKVATIEEHHMHEEFYEITTESANILNQAMKEGRRIIAVGTTSVRTLEANYARYQRIQATYESTNIFIYPGYKFQVVQGLITNFHLPKSTLLMLVSAFASKDFVTKAYHEAIEKRYRFFSFGDSMIII